MFFIKFNPPLIAHRGANKIAPENSLSAFLAAKKLGAQWLEFDVMLTADQEAVVIHDETLERTTNGHGKVADYSFAEIQALDAGSWFDSRFASEKITALRTVLDLVKREGLSANIEIKSVGGREELVVNKVFADLEFCWGRQIAPILISSFSLPILHAVRRRDQQVPLALLIHAWFDEWESLAAELNCVAINLNNEIITADVVAKIKTDGRQVLCYTVNDVARARELFSWGVSAVFTDNLAVMLAAFLIF